MFVILKMIFFDPSAMKSFFSLPFFAVKTTVPSLPGRYCKYFVSKTYPDISHTSNPLSNPADGGGGDRVPALALALLGVAFLFVVVVVEAYGDYRLPRYHDCEVMYIWKYK